MVRAEEEHCLFLYREESARKKYATKQKRATLGRFVGFSVCVVVTIQHTHTFICLFPTHDLSSHLYSCYVSPPFTGEVGFVSYFGVGKLYSIAAT